MAPEEKNLKWSPKAELDLCVALLVGSQDGERVRYNWAKVTSIMQSLDYAFTKDAMTQHFSKTIMKDFKARSEAAAPDAPDAGPDAPDAAPDAPGADADQPPQTPKPDKPKKAATPRKKGTATPAKDGPPSVKRRRGRKAADEGGEADGGSAKKTKTEDEGESPAKVKDDAAADAEDKTDEEDGGGVKMEAAPAA